MRLMRRQRGAGIIAAVAIIVLFSLLGATLNRMFQASTQSAVEQHSGSDAFLVAEAGLLRGVMELTAGTCPPPTLTAVSTAGGEYTVTYTAIPDSDAYWITATGYVPTAADPTWQRTLTQVQTCGGSGGNLFSGDNETDWNRSGSLISDGSVTFTSDNQADDIQSTGQFELDEDESGEVYFRTTFSTDATSGVTLLIDIKFQGNDHLWCGSESSGFDVTTDTVALTCTREDQHGTIYTTHTSSIDADGAIDLHLGTFTPEDVEQIDINVFGLSGSETLTLNDACLAITCPDSSSSSALRNWREL